VEKCGVEGGSNTSRLKSNGLAVGENSKGFPTKTSGRKLRESPFFPAVFFRRTEVRLPPVKTGGFHLNAQTRNRHLNVGLKADEDYADED
jgi:hypothetical protein